jgi:hypothetical protein
MTGITTYLSILTLNVNGLNSPITVWQTGLKRKIQQSVVYRRHISLTETSTDLRWKTGRRFTKPMALKTGSSSNTYLRQSRLQTYIDHLDKVHFKLTLLKWDKGHSTLIKGEIHQMEANDLFFSITDRLGIQEIIVIAIKSLSIRSWPKTRISTFYGFWLPIGLLLNYMEIDIYLLPIFLTIIPNISLL